jgi:hypothetical protein
MPLYPFAGSGAANAQSLDGWQCVAPVSPSSRIASPYALLACSSAARRSPACASGLCQLPVHSFRVGTMLRAKHAGWQQKLAFYMPAMRCIDRATVTASAHLYHAALLQALEPVSCHSRQRAQRPQAAGHVVGREHLWGRRLEAMATKSWRLLRGLGLQICLHSQGPNAVAVHVEHGKLPGLPTSRTALLPGQTRTPQKDT